MNDTRSYFFWMMSWKQTDANRAELLLCSQVVIISTICISNSIPSCGRRRDNNMQMSSSEWEKKKKPWWGTDSRNFLFGTPDNKLVSLFYNDGLEAKEEFPSKLLYTQSGNKKSKSLNKCTVSSVFSSEFKLYPPKYVCLVRYGLMVNLNFPPFNFFQNTEN